MVLTPPTLSVPLQTDNDGVIRVGSTRVTLDIVVEAFQHGHGAETIAEMYSAVSLAEVYAVIAYYLQHRAQIDQYLEERAALGEQVRRENEARFDLSALHDRLLAELEEKRQGKA